MGKRAVRHAWLDAQHLAEQNSEILPIPVGISLRIAGPVVGAPVSETYVQKAIRTEDEVSAVVVGKGLGKEQDRSSGRDVRTAVPPGVLDDIGVSPEVGVIDVGEATRG
jgi:hypothetical protein